MYAKGSKAGGKSKRPRNLTTLAFKLEVIKLYEEGTRPVDIARELGIPPSTARAICKDAFKYKSHAKTVSARDTILADMEKQLAAWIDDQTQNLMPPNASSIKVKAKMIFDELRGHETEEFTPSSTWFDRFKIRFGFYKVSMDAESPCSDLPSRGTCQGSDCWFAQFQKMCQRDALDPEGIAGYPNLFKQLIEKKGFGHRQVFNVNETGLFWRKMPKDTFVLEEDHAKPSDNRITLLLGGNAAGDFKLKPLLVYHEENPTALEGIDKTNLPVTWWSNKKASVTHSIFTDWFCNCFCPEVSDYLRESNLEDKALLILDHAPCHPMHLGDLCDGKVTVIFLPPKTTSFLQPMDQGVVAYFKAYYLRRTFTQVAKAIRSTGSTKPIETWRGYDILKAIDNICLSWNEVSCRTMNGAWKGLWPDCVEDMTTSVETIAKIQDNMVTFGKSMGFKFLKAKGIDRLLTYDSQDLSHDDLVKLDDHRESEKEDEECDATDKVLTVDNLSEAFQHLDIVKNILERSDPDTQRSSKVTRDLEKCMRTYRDILERYTRTAK